MRSLLFTLCLTMLASTANAQNPTRYSCASGTLTRFVEIKYETGVTVPCEVHYTKPDEAQTEPEVLWRALNEEGYCEARTADFVERLRSYGWQCSSDAAPADDTESLSPSDEVEADGESQT